MMQGYDWFIEHFHKATGIDLNEYKRPQMERRLTALRDRRGFATFEDYLSAALRDNSLMAELLDRMTINVSEFFRNQSRWDALVEKILPRIAQTGPVRVWSAACSTGEEPYTLLLALLSHVALSNISVLATDIDENALKRAKEGNYPAEALKPIPEDLRNNHFRLTEGGHATISDRIRDRVEFRRHNLLRDPYPSGFDLIICRNVLIYFTDSAKEGVYRNFARALRPGGVLFVGSTEQVFHPEAFGLKQIEPFFYQRV